MNIALGATGPEVFGAAFAAITAQTEAYGYGIPTKDDVFAYFPLAVSTVLPDMPAVA